MCQVSEGVSMRLMGKMLKITGLDQNRRLSLTRALEFLMGNKAFRTTDRGLHGGSFDCYFVPANKRWKGGGAYY